MKIIKITISSGQTFNHPFERFANLRTHVSLEATIDDFEAWTACAKSLQMQADALSARHRQQLLDTIEVTRKAKGKTYEPPDRDEPD